MTEQNTQTIFATASYFDMAIPKEVRQAEDLHDAAILLLAEIEGEIEPDLDGLTVKNLRQIHQSTVEYANRDARLDAARRLSALTLDRLDMVKFQKAQQFWNPMAERFDTTAKTFNTALTELGGDTTGTRAIQSPDLAAIHQRLLTASTDMDMLRQARDAFAQLGRKAETINTTFEPISRYAVISDKEAMIRLPRPAAGPEFWTELLHYRCALRWQTPAEQEANSTLVAATRVETRMAGPFEDSNR